MVDLVLDDRVKLSVSVRGEKYLIEIYDVKDKKLVSFVDSYPNLIDSAFTRGRVRNEILKYMDYERIELDKKIMKAVIENRDALRAL